MKTAAAHASTPSFHPVARLRDDLGDLHRRIAALASEVAASDSRDLETRSPSELKWRNHLVSGLEVYVGQLDYFVESESGSLADEWLLLVDSLELQAEWLSCAARELRQANADIAGRLSELATFCTDLMVPTVAVRLWHNRQSGCGRARSEALSEARRASEVAAAVHAA